MNSPAPRPTKCRHCGRPWKVPAGVDASKRYCNACSGDRQAAATAHFGVRTYKPSADGRWLISQKEPPMDTPLPELAPLPPGARALFKPPFQAIGVEGRMLFVYDSAGRMVASRDSRTGMPIPRGHGRHCYLPNGLTHHDAWCDWFEANVPGTATLEETTKALNRAWAAPP